MRRAKEVVGSMSPFQDIFSHMYRVKEFEGIEDNPKKQILRLKHILEGLGMTGRLSMDKAKAIRAKRELEEEIRE